MTPVVSAVAVESKSHPKANLHLAVRSCQGGLGRALKAEGDQNCSYLGMQFFL